MADEKRVKVVFASAGDFVRQVEDDPGIAKLIADGWVVATTIILDDPRRADHERHQIAFVLTRPERSVVAIHDPRVLAVLVAWGAIALAIEVAALAFR